MYIGSLLGYHSWVLCFVFVFEFGGVYVSLFLFTCRSSQFNTLPKRKSTENMFAIGTGAGSTGDGVMTGRSLPGEKQPRSGSWNTHKRIASPVLPNKYLTPDKQRYALWLQRPVLLGKVLEGEGTCEYQSRYSRVPGMTIFTSSWHVRFILYLSWDHTNTCQCPGYVASSLFRCFVLYKVG